MKSTSTLNISPDLHKIVKIKAAETGAKIGDYADALIEVGLKHLQEVHEIVELRRIVSSAPTTK